VHRLHYHFGYVLGLIVISVAFTLVLTAINAALEARRFVRMRRVPSEA